MMGPTGAAEGFAAACLGSAFSVGSAEGSTSTGSSTAGAESEEVSSPQAELKREVTINKLNKRKSMVDSQRNYHGNQEATYRHQAATVFLSKVEKKKAARLMLPQETPETCRKIGQSDRLKIVVSPDDRPSLILNFRCATGKVHISSDCVSNLHFNRVECFIHSC
tara:strand:+ start:1177 stop:1671 length:495 start_codon:yes stop_codon:yes gene_type:complete